MARHASGKNNYRLSAGLLTALAAVAVLAIAVAAIVVTRSVRDQPGGAADDAARCVSGELVLPVAASSKVIAQKLVDDYRSANSVVRDYCVNPTVVDSLSDAAVYVAAESPQTTWAISDAGRSTASETPTSVASVEVGLAGRTPPADAKSVPLSDVVFPTDDSVASAAVATRLSNDEAAAAAAVTNQRVATAKDADTYAAVQRDTVPDGFSFFPLDASVVFGAYPLNQAGSVTEDQARAGQDFARRSGESFSAPANSISVSDAAWAAAEAAPSPPTEAAPAAEITDTLFLVDTSTEMAPYYDAVAQGVASASQEAVSAGHRVGLWNYSSPLTAGVTKGYRQNVNLTDSAADIGTALGRFGTGGQPQTREAVNAALEYALALGAPLRIVVITTGTSDGGDDAACADAIRAAEAGGVTLSVVHVGSAPRDGVLANTATQSASEADADAAKIAAAITAATT
ncbi:von Willebrand factor type A domain protein [Corynebacterium capitovis DSM 44611]|uniref:VWA domain-containing protein n=1 Tax=Corynebacterium capitovis TaxID=131081 RepID=UPI000365ECBD|nr:VWA domain-containing protein [Corynebacterium capitovis]WKD57703.1 von Willebrand factor type A domain protein [Corynebacterium capitovis DSM 44611]